MARCQRGSTLIETTVAASLLVMLLTCVYGTLSSSLFNYTLFGNAADLQQSALVGLSRLVQELPEADPASIRFDASPAGVVFVSPRCSNGTLQFGAAGDLMWQKYVCYYLGTVQGRSTLIRKEASLVDSKGNPLPAQAFPPPLWPSRSTTYFSTLAGPYLAVAFNVTGLTFSGTNAVLITITTHHSGMGKTDQIQLLTTTLMRN